LNARFEHLGIEQGLPNNLPNLIYADGDGYIWVATSEGLCRYDGYGFRVYRPDLEDEGSLSNADVSVMYEGHTGALWIGANGGLNRLDRKNGKFQHFTHDPNDAKSISSDFITAICEDGNGALWIGTADAGLNKFDSKAGVFMRVLHDSTSATPMAKSLSDNRIRAMVRDHAGVLWIGTRDGCLNRLDPTKNEFDCYFDSRSDSKTFGKEGVRTLCEDHSGNLWIGTYEAGLKRFDTITGKFHRFVHNPKDPKSLNSNTVRQVLVDQSGVLWIGTDGGGLDKWVPGRREVEHFVNDPKNPTSLGNDFVLSLCEDRSGTIWIGTMVGLNKLYPRRNRFRNFSHDPDDPKSLSSDHVAPIYEDRSGNLWVSTHGGGLNRFDHTTGAFEHFIHDPGNPNSIGSDNVTDVCEDRSGTYWISTWGGGLNKFDLKRKEFRHFTHDPKNPKSISSDDIDPVYEDRSGMFWIGTLNDGLNKFDPKSGEFKHFFHDPNTPNSLSDNTIWGFEVDTATQKGEILWIATGNGFTRFDVQREEFQQFLPDPHHKQSPSNNIMAIHKDQSSAIWLGTVGGGLFYFNQASGTFTQFTTKDGLPNNIIWCIEEDDHGRLWLSTSNGLSRFDPHRKWFKNYDLDDGLQGSEFNGGSHCKTRSGELCFGGTNGFTMFHPDSIKENTHIPQIVITELKKSGKPFDITQVISSSGVIELSYKENFFSFEFAALDFVRPEKNRYAYKLEGFNEDWIDCGLERSATFMNLEGGRYTFRVKGSNNDGVWNEEGTSIAVVITPPFWKTWWFTTLLWMILAGSAGGTVRYVEMRKIRERMRILEQQQALDHERLRISRDMHDEVGATLTEIAILSELAKKDEGQATTGIHIQKISERSREVVDNIGEIIWAINPKHDHLIDLAAYLRQYAAQYFRVASIRCRFEFPDTVPDLQLSAEARRNIFLVVKESLHNVVKHSKATEVVVRFTLVDQKMEIVIRDNGIGFSLKDATSLGNGLHSMKERMEDVGGRFVVESQPRCGTTVSLSVSLKSRTSS